MRKPILFILSVVLFGVVSASEAREYKMKIGIDNPTPTSRTNYPVRINVDGKTLIDAGLMNSDMRDIRFESDLGANLPFWIHISEGMQRKIKNLPIWVKLDTLPAGGTKYIYMSYDIDRTKTSSPLPLSGTPPVTTFCGDHATSPFSNDRCGDDVFGDNGNVPDSGLFSFDYRDYGTGTLGYTPTTNFGGVWGAASLGTDWRISPTLLTPFTHPANTATPPTFFFESNNAFKNSFLVHFRYHLYGNDQILYLLTQKNDSPANVEGTYMGYKIFLDTGTSPSLFHDYKIKIYRRTVASAGWIEADTWDRVNYPTAGGITWQPYNNSIQDFDVKVTSSMISIYINGKEMAKVSRTGDSFTGGYAGFSTQHNTGGEQGSYSTHTISPIWVINDYIGEEPKVTFLGHTDLLIKRVKPTPDSADTGRDLIEGTPNAQILEDSVDGNNLDKYIYSNYPLANPTNQIFKQALTIRNRGDATDTFSIDLALTGETSHWNVAYDYGSGITSNLPGVGGTNTSGSVTIPGGESVVINTTVMPSIGALFEGAYGKLIMDFEVFSTSDYSFDHARLIANVNAKSGCYWGWRLPITVSYNDINTTGALIDHQVLVNLAGLDFTDARADGDDIIFTDASGTYIPFWTKAFNQAAGTASYWVKVHTINSGLPGSTTIYMWWGNPNYSPTRSNKKATFDLWEDWESRTVGARPGCPDGTGSCAGQATDPDWKNNPDSGDNYNWWKIDNTQLNGKSILADTIKSADYGPILSLKLDSGAVKWTNYEAMYSLKRNSGGTNATYSPVLFADPGNQWGTEYYANTYIFRPSSYGTDWTWPYQTSPTSLSGYDGTFPIAGGKYVNKIRVFHNPATGQIHHTILITKSNVTPLDGDLDTGFFKIADFYPDPAFSVDSGAIGFGGWDGRLSFDDIRVRKLTEPEPACTPGSVAPLVHDAITTLSSPTLTPPLLNGRPVLLNANLTTWAWTGDLTAVYADCYISGDCKAGEDATKLGTISLWGKSDDNTPKGFGEQLKTAIAGDDNRASPGGGNWQVDGRYIFTAHDSDASGGTLGGDCTPPASGNSGDCLAFGVSNADKLEGLVGYTPEVLPVLPYTRTTNLIKFARGQYLDPTVYPGFDRSDVREDVTCLPLHSEQCQWKLGDVTHSNPLVVGVPNMLYADPDYTAYLHAKNDRDMVAYFSSNEGMLHAVRMATFNTTTKKYRTDTAATELWGFIPNALLSSLSGITDAYHEYTADGLLRAIDIKSGGSYKTVLIGGLRSGGQSLYALDITEPRSPKLMWEINAATHPTEFSNIGQTWSAPAIGRLCESTQCDYKDTTSRWVAILGSGFDPNEITNLSKSAHLSIINLENGAIIKQIQVSTKPGNIATNISVLRDKNGYIGKVFFGDSYGAVWRINLMSKSDVDTTLAKSALTTADMLFEPSDYTTSDINTSPPQRPVTSQPVIAYAKNAAGGDLFWVYFGTGVYDLYDPSYPHQRIYGLRDDRTGQYTDDAAALAAATIVDMTASTTVNADRLSWYMELGHTDGTDVQYDGATDATCVSSCTSGGQTANYCNASCKNVAVSTKERNERVLTTPTIYGGFLFFSTFAPSSVTCDGGEARFYAVTFDTGAYDSGLMLFGNATDTRSIAVSTTGGVPSTPLIYSGKSGGGQIVAAGLVDVSTGGLVSTALDPTKFTENMNFLLWRRIR